MKRTYSIKQKLKHGALFPLRYIWPYKLRLPLWKLILKYQNSVPLYLVLRNGDTAIQVGTPNTQTLRNYSKLVGAEGHVVLIEADAKNCSTLLQYKNQKALSNVTIICKGCWSKEGTLEFRKSAEYDGDHRFDVDSVFVDNDLRTNLNTVEQVQVDTLDNILEALDVSKINYLSATVNGAELEVLKGANDTLANSDDIRIFTKGHARLGTVDSEQTLNKHIEILLNNYQYCTVISKGEMSPTGEAGWGQRAGDVFAWK